MDMGFEPVMDTKQLSPCGVSINHHLWTLWATKRLDRMVRKRYEAVNMARRDYEAPSNTERAAHIAGYRVH